jgi:hypothetical protein
MKSNLRSAWGTLDILIRLATVLLFFVLPATSQTPTAVCPGWSVTDDVRMAIDLNLDGMSDLAAFDNPSYSFNPSGLWTAINNGNGTFSVQKAIADLDALNIGDPTKHTRTLADLTGHHRADVVIFGDAGVWTVVANNDGTYSPTPHLLNNFGVQQGWDSLKHVRIVADLNHDGFADIIGFGESADVRLPLH